MTLSIPLSPETEAKLRSKAQTLGVDVATYAARVLEQSVAPPRSLTEISGPVYRRFIESGMSEEELVRMLEEEKHALRRERRGGQAS